MSHKHMYVGVSPSTYTAADFYQHMGTALQNELKPS